MRTHSSRVVLLRCRWSHAPRAAVRVGQSQLAGDAVLGTKPHIGTRAPTSFFVRVAS